MLDLNLYSVTGWYKEKCIMTVTKIFNKSQYGYDITVGRSHLK